MGAFGFETDRNNYRESMASSTYNSDDQIRQFLWEYIHRIILWGDSGDELSPQIVGYFLGCLDIVRNRLTDDYNAHAGLQQFATAMKTVPDAHLDDVLYVARALHTQWVPQENPWLKIGPPDPNSRNPVP